MSQNQDCFLEQYTATQMLRSETDGHNLACGIVYQRIHHQRHLESQPSASKQIDMLLHLHMTISNCFRVPDSTQEPICYGQ